jgi:2-hydroxychromene-2-carboxylate isomerase
MLVFYHRVDDPWSHLLLQVLPQMLATYDVGLECVTVPLPPEVFFPRPDLVARHALRDATDLARHCVLEFRSSGKPPSPELATLASARLLAEEGDTAAYLALARTLGDALFGDDRERLHALCQTGAPGAAEASERLAANQRRQLADGHYNSAMIRCGGTWYWGVDRLHHLEHDLVRAGRKRPSASVGLLQRRPAGRAVADVPAASPGAWPLVIDFYCSFRSPYAYLAAQRAFDLQRRYHVRVRPRLILPMKMAGYVIPETKSQYFRADPAREALRHGVRFGNFADPFGRGLERAMALVDLADGHGRLEAYILSVMQGVWADGIDTATDDGMQQLVERAGLDWAGARPHLDDTGWRTWAATHRAELESLGQYAAPTFRLDDWVTWGQDRLWMLEIELRARLGLPAC